VLFVQEGHFKQTATNVCSCIDTLHTNVIWKKRFVPLLMLLVLLIVFNGFTYTAA